MQFRLKRDEERLDDVALVPQMFLQIIQRRGAFAFVRAVASQHYEGMECRKGDVRRHAHDQIHDLAHGVALRWIGQTSGEIGKDVMGLPLRRRCRRGAVVIKGIMRCRCGVRGAQFRLKRCEERLDDVVLVPQMFLQRIQRREAFAFVLAGEPTRTP